MKKLLTLVLIVALMLTLFSPVVYAKKGGNSDSAAKAEKVQERAEAKADFEARKSERAALRDMRKDQLKEQKEITKQYKEQLRLLKEELDGLSEEERALRQGEVDDLKAQVKAAQKYRLEVKSALQDSIYEIKPGMRMNPPEDEEVEDIIDDVVDEL